MTNKRDASGLFSDAVRREMFRGWREMFTGRRAAGNVVTLEGAPTGKTWVRPSKGSWEAIAVLGVASQVDAKVWVGPDISGRDRIYYVSEDTFFEFGDKGHLVLTPPISGRINILEVAGQNFIPGRLVPDPDSGPMYVKVEPFAHPSGLFDGPAIDLTAYLPTTAGMNAWIAVAADPVSNTLTAYTGDETWEALNAMPETDAFAINIPTGHYPAGAIALNSDTTAIGNGRRIVDLRVHFGQVGFPALDELSNVNSTGKADGDALVWDAGAGEWVPGAGGGGGSIDVTDGTTTVSPATELLLDGAKFAVTDNGGGQAEVTLLSGAVTASGSKTRITETVLYENTLGANGAWDVANADLAAGAGDFDDYDELIIQLTGIRGTVNGVQDRVLLLFGTGGGGLDTTAANYYSSSLYAGSDNNVNVFGGGSLNKAEIAGFPATTGHANSVSDFTILIQQPGSSKHKNAIAHGILRWTATSQVYMAYALAWENTGAIDRIGIRTDNHATDLIAAGGSIRIIGRREEAIGGLDTSTANVSNPPTDAELDSALGTPAAVGAGYQCLLDDGGADTNVYLVTSNGTSWWYTALTKAT